MTIKEEHGKAKALAPVYRSGVCNKVLTYSSGNIQLIPRGKGFHKVSPTKTFTFLQNERKKYEELIKQSKQSLGSTI